MDAVSDVAVQLLLVPKRGHLSPETRRYLTRGTEMEGLPGEVRPYITECVPRRIEDTSRASCECET